VTGNLPLIDILADCQTHGERAEWLLACPLAILREHSLSIRIVLQRAGFHPGITYVEAERAALSATRLPNGNHKPPARAWRWRPGYLWRLDHEFQL
jgi:hypothetical protein